MNKQYIFHNAVKHNLLDEVELLLEDKDVNPSSNKNFMIRLSSLYGYIDMTKLLLNDKRVNPSDLNNLAIISAFEKGTDEIVNLLWKHQSVKNTLINDDINLYNILVAKNILKKLGCF
jgi:hypothetical protein